MGFIYPILDNYPNNFLFIWGNSLLFFFYLFEITFFPSFFLFLIFLIALISIYKTYWEEGLNEEAS